MAAIYFMGSVVGFSGPGIVSGLAALGALVGGGMLAGIGVVVAVPVVLGGGGVFLARKLNSKRLKEAKKKLREHARARHAFLRKLITENADLGEQLSKYRYRLERLTIMIEDLDE